MLFDRAGLLELVAGDAGMVARVAEMLLQRLPGMLTEVRDTLAQRDEARFQAAVHTLRGSVASFGAAPLMDLTRRLELSGIDDAAPDLVTQVWQLGSQLEAELHQALVVSAA